MRAVAPRGALSEFVLERLARAPHALPAAPPVEPLDALADDDLHLALYLCYELHYRGLPGVDEAWEWEPSLLAFRAEAEGAFERALRAGVPPPDPVGHREMDRALRAIGGEGEGGPSLSVHLEREGTLEEFREFLVHRSAYQLREADPHSWAIPRLEGRAKAALVEIQADEYGGGDPERIHARLFAKAMAALGLDPSYGAHVDRIPGVTLATVNAMSLFGLHRRWRGAVVGHLARFEMTSAVPNRRYGNGLRRLGAPAAALDFFDEHVEADAVHESIAAVDLAGGLAEREPGLAGQILFGAAVLEALERRWADGVLDAWAARRSSLRPGARAPAPA